MKANKSDLEELEKIIMQRLNDIVIALTNQFADKADTKKALKLLERQIKNLYELIMNKQGGTDENDAMFSRKPLGGMSCASCEKDLINLAGKKVEFMPWQKMPYRDPTDRISRVGQGFSKLLSMINPDQVQRYEMNNKFQSEYGAAFVEENTSQTLPSRPTTANTRIRTSAHKIGKRPQSANPRRMTA